VIEQKAQGGYVEVRQCLQLEQALIPASIVSMATAFNYSGWTRKVRISRPNDSAYEVIKGNLLIVQTTDLAVATKHVWQNCGQFAPHYSDVAILQPDGLIFCAIDAKSRLMTSFDLISKEKVNKKGKQNKHKVTLDPLARLGP